MSRAWLVALCLALASCIEKAPDYVISRGKMERILYDYVLAQSMAEHETGDNNALQYAYVRAVFQKHHVSEADFDSSMVWYARDASTLYAMYGRVAQRLEREANAMGANVGDMPLYTQLATEGDTANVWRASSFLTLSGDEFDNLQRFTVKADTSFRAGDYYKFVCETAFVPITGFQEAYCMMQVSYTNDSTFSQVQRLSGGMTTEMSVPEDSVRNTWKTRSLRFTFYMPLESVSPLPTLCCLSHVALVRYHRQRPKPPVAPFKSDSDSVAVDTLPLR